MSYQICKRCIMDNVVDPMISFDEEGVCIHCREFDNDIAKLPKTDAEKKEVFDAIISRIKRDGAGKMYDCVLGISGGVDSAYLTYIAKEAGLRILAVHVDAGWNSDIAVENIKKLCSALDVDLHTVVVDWNTMKELQRAYMFSGLVNLDVPQDHAFLAATYKYARKHHVKYMLNGSNYATEGILPKNWGYSPLDYRNIKDVYKKCGRGKISLKKYPHMSLLLYSLTYLCGSKRINLLNYVPYSKSLAINTLHEKFGWNYYGGKHYESRFTKYYQGVYLPEKFGFDKKRAHISSLIVGGELSREKALMMMEDHSDYPKDQIENDKEYILKKLDISKDEWENILKMPSKTEDDYKNNKKMLGWMIKIKSKVK